MKELSIEEKARAYDEDLETARKINSGEGVAAPPDWTICEVIFPELKESEEEKIRKALIEMVHDTTGDSLWVDYNVHKEDALAWLKKQGDKDKLIKELGEYKVKYTQEVLEKHINSMSNKDDERLRKTTIAFLKDFAEQGYENAVECIDWLEKHDEQKESLCDKCKKAQPSHSCQDITALGRCYIENINTSINKVEPKFKVGDWIVLSTSDGEKVVQIDSIEYFKSGEPRYITSEGRWFGNGTKARLLTDKDGETVTIPESKIVVKQKHAWSEEDKKRIFRIKLSLQKDMMAHKNSGCDIADLQDCEDWLMNLYESYIVRPKQEWSEEDERICRAIVADIANDKSICKYEISKSICDEQINWLKSLKDRYTWKPSGEQINVLNEVLNFAANHESPHWNDYIFGTLNNLIIQLKKLREE